MKKLLLFLYILFCSFAAIAQTTAVTGTITDGDGTLWFNAHVTVTWVPNPNYPNANQYTLNGQPLSNSSALLQQTVLTNSSGIFNVNVIDNNLIAPSGSTYKFVIQSYTSAPSSTFPNLAITGSAQNVSSFIATNITNPRFPASTQMGGAFGYGTNEVSVTPIPGGSFFNVTSGVIDVWACNPSGCSWQTQAVGSFCSSISCSFTTSVFSPNINNVCETSQQAGSDFVAQLIACENASYMTTGGMITAYGYGNTTQTSTTVLPSLGTSTQPLALFLNPATLFKFGEVLGTTASPSNCIFPIGNASSIHVGAVAFTKTTMQLTPTARAFDMMCNAIWDGTQEGLSIEGVTLIGDPGGASVLTGSLLHIKNVFVPTKIENVGTYYPPSGTAFTLDGGSDIQLWNDVFNDSATSGNYPGATVVFNCPNRVTVNGGAIQNNGLFNALLVMNSVNTNSTGCPSIGGGSSQPTGVHMYNVDIEGRPATIGSFGGHMTNVDRIQLNDPSDIVIDGTFVYGTKGIGENHIIDILYSGANGQVAGPVEIDNLGMLPVWAGLSVIHNNWANTALSLKDIIPTENSSSAYMVGKYRWEGSSNPINNTIDYLDNENIANLTTQILSVTSIIATNLPTCNSGYEGHIIPVTDSTTKIWGASITGGGTYHVKAYCNGTLWSVDAGGSTASITTVSQSQQTCASGCANVQTPCTTTGLAWQAGSCSMTIPWPITFVDANYSSGCNAIAPSGATLFAIVNSHAANQIQVFIEASSAAANTPTEIDCWGIHN